MIEGLPHAVMGVLGRKERDEVYCRYLTRAFVELQRASLAVHEQNHHRTPWLDCITHNADVVGVVDRLVFRRDFFDRFAAANAPRFWISLYGLDGHSIEWCRPLMVRDPCVFARGRHPSRDAHEHGDARVPIGKTIVYVDQTVAV